MKTWIVLLAISLSYLSIELAHATSGRTNSSGCHNSKKAGYHCHGTPKKIASKPKSKGVTTSSLSSKKPKQVDGLVLRIQVELDALGYYVGKIDGVIGRNTISAIKKYQSEHNLLVNGKATSDLLLKLVAPNN